MPLKKERGSNKKSGLCKWAINEDITIYQIEGFKKELSADLDGYDTFMLSLGGVEDIDSAGVQLLLALNAELKRNKKMLTLTSISGGASKLFNLYGIKDNFNWEIAQ